MHDLRSADTADAPATTDATVGRGGRLLRRSVVLTLVGAALALGSEGVDVSGERPEFETPGVPVEVSDPAEARSLRQRLVHEIARAEEAEAEAAEE